MKLRYLMVAFAAAALCCACNKDDDDDDTTYLTFSGTPDYDIPVYVEVGKTYEMVPDEVTRASGDESTASVGYVWYITPYFSTYDTLRFEGDDPGTHPISYSLTVPDTLCTFSITCYAYADGYSSSSCETSCVSINLGTSLSKHTMKEDCYTFTDARDSREYQARRIGGKDWMCENLAYGGSGSSFYESEVMDNLLGRMYNWNEAMEACPEGWTLPSNEDFLDLANAVKKQDVADAFTRFEDVSGDLMVLDSLNGIRLWEYAPAVDINNSTCFSALPVGYATESGEYLTFNGSPYYSCFWTCDEAGSQAYYRYIYMDNTGLGLGRIDKDTFYTTVRCVRK